MRLTQEQETRLIEDNMKKVYNSVDNFIHRNSVRVIRIPYEDFVQEALLAYLEYLRKCETEEELQVFPWYDCKQAMCQLVLRFQPISVPKRSQTFSNSIHTVPRTVAMDVAVVRGMDVDGMSRFWTQDVETRVDFDRFMADQSTDAQRMVALRMNNIKNRAIASQCGVSDVTISKRLKKLRIAYEKFLEEE